jgi:tetratricopeptide (TPR) repeat protein
VEDVLPLFASLSLPLHGRQAADTATTDLQRRQTLDRLVAWLIATSAERPTAVIVEDLHWIDASTKELLDMLIEQVPTSPIMLVITSRPSPNLPWTGRASVTHVTLSPLTHEQVGAMIDRLTGASALPATVRRAVTTKTDGVPLFVEEVTKAILEAGAERAAARSSIDVPATLQDSLMARLDRLGSPKDVAQLAAVLGREFSYELLHAVAPADPVFLDHSLRALVRAELVYQRGVPPHATYRFKHALVQEAAYRSLLKSRRQEAHARVVRVLEERFADRVAAGPEEIARHCAQAGLVAQAVRYYRLAGQRAAAAAAHVEAVGHLTKALDLIRDVTQDPDRDREELAIRVALGPPLIAIRGYGDREVERTYERARTLCETIGEAPDLFEAVWGLANYYQSRGELGTARTLAEQLVTVSERSSEALLIAWAHLQLGATTFWRGEPAAAMPHFERAIAVHDPSAGLRLRGAPDPGVAARAYAAWALWQLGHADRALETCRESVALGRRCGDRFSLALALCFACAQHQLRREPDAVRAYAEEVVALSTAHGFPVWRGMGQLGLGWALAYSPDGAKAIETIRDAMAQLVRVGTEVGAAWGLAVLADAERALGHEAEALAAVETGLAVAAQHDDHVSDSELLRLKGELLVRTDPHAAEAAFRRAVAMARAHRSPIAELRAATSLARFLVHAGREAEARAVLAGATERVHEGLDTPDVRDATELAREPAFAR